MLDLYQAFDTHNIQAIEKSINACLIDSIIFRERPPFKFACGEGRAYVPDSLRESGQVMDGGNTDEEKDSFYHAMVLGICRARRGWRVKSNREVGGGTHCEAILNGTAELAVATPGARADTRGRADIILIDRVRQCGHIIEIKYAKSAGTLKSRAKAGLRQIENTHYDEYFSDSDIQTIYHYGIAFHQKKCAVTDAG